MNRGAAFESFAGPGGEGVGQAKDYAGKLAVRFTYATNGRGIYAIDMQDGAEGELAAFPKPDELWNRTFEKPNAWCDRFAVIPYEDKGGSHPSRYYQDIASLAVANDSTSFPLRVDADGNGSTDWLYFPGGAVVSVERSNEPSGSTRPEVSLTGNMPNPFFGSTTLYFRVSGHPVDARLMVCDVAGRIVHSRGLGSLGIENQAVPWNGQHPAGRRVPAGVYFWRIVYKDGASAARRLVVLR